MQILISTFFLVFCLHLGYGAGKFIASILNEQVTRVCVCLQSCVFLCAKYMKNPRIPKKIRFMCFFLLFLIESVRSLSMVTINSVN